MDVYLAFISKHNSNCENQIIISMIPNEEVWHHLAVKKLSALLRGITSEHDCHFYGLNCLHSIRAKNKLALHKKVCEDKNFCGVVMPSEHIKTL